MKIYTKRGDKGQTVLAGGQPVAKDDLRVEAYGTIDELLAQTGCLLDHLEVGRNRDFLLKLQSSLFRLGGVIAAPDREIADDFMQARIVALEGEIDRLSADLPPLRQFILPGGHPAVSSAHLARTVCRRAERRLLQLQRREHVPASALAFLNRLSDFLFILARHLARCHKVEEIPYQPDHAS